MAQPVAYSSAVAQNMPLKNSIGRLPATGAHRARMATAPNP